MSHAGCSRVLEEVPSRRGEEFHDGRLLERRRVRNVDDDRRALKGFREPLAGESVDAGIW
jgi:hypothetical protein